MVSIASDPQVSKPAYIYTYIYIYIYIYVYNIHVYMLIHIIYITTSNDVSPIYCVYFTDFEAGMSTYICIYVCTYAYEYAYMCIYIFVCIHNPFHTLDFFPQT